MKKLLLFLALAAAGLQAWADDLYLVGDATPIGWLYGGRDATRMTESDGAYTWTGFLQKGGFKICTAQETWDGYHPESADLEINPTGATQTMTTDNGADYKWKVVNPGIYVVTVSLSANTISITPDWYDIGTADELIDFASDVNTATENNHAAARWARLTADIDMSGKTFNGIGGDGKWIRYHGTLDGQGHKISNLNMTNQHCALITVAGGGCTVKNLLIDNTCSFNGEGRNAALISCCNYTDFGIPVTILNCGNEANVSGTANNCAGLLGCNYGNGIRVTIKNSFNAGDINCTGSESAPISGWLGSNARVENTYNIGSISNSNSNNSFARWDGSGSSYENCYSTLNWGNSISGKTLGYPAENVASGLLCFTLNGNQSGGEDWLQTLPSDTHPYPGVFANHAKVYANGDLHCDGTPKGSVTYSNTEGETRDAHDYTDGFCSYCHELDVDYLTPVDGYYQIGTMHDLHWFSQYVNAGNTTANAKLTADIEQASENEFGYTPIGTQTHPYIGTFDGQAHSVTLRINNPGYSYQGLFGVVTDGVKIEKVIVKGYVTGNNYVGGIVGGTNDGSSNAKKTDIWYCGNEATITASGANGAGIIGVNMNGSASIILTNCYNTGNITSGSDGGALSGWLGGGWSSVTNCYNIGAVTVGSNTSKAFGRNSGCHFTNCYFTTTSGTDNSTENHNNGQPTEVADAAVASGELCYKLNGDQSNIAFYQLLAPDTHPTINYNQPKVFKLTVGQHGWASFVPEVNIPALPTGVTAYVGQKNGNSLHLEAVTALPADNAFVVNAAQGEYYYNNTTENITLTEDNDLDFYTEATEASGTQYCLSNKSQGVGFYQVQAGVMIPARKAYIDIPASTKAFYGFDDNATGIENLNVNANFNGAIYNVAGQRLNKVQKGINIVNGKKILK